VLSWLKRVNDFYNAMVVRAQMTAAMVWDDTVKGSDADVQRHVAFVQANPPSAGEVFAHNEAITRQLLGGGGQRGPSMDPVGEALLNLVGVGVGIPKEYLGVSTHGARATALVATEPSAKKFEDRQLTIEWLLTQLAYRVFAVAGISRAEWDIEFTFPSIATEDRSAKMKDLALAESGGWIAHRTAATVAAKELMITSYDYDDEMGLVKKEIGEDPEKVTSGLYPMINKLVTAKGTPGTGGVPSGTPGGQLDHPGAGVGGPEGKPGTVPPGEAPEKHAGSSPRMGGDERAEQNPLTTAGASGIRADLKRKESVAETFTNGEHGEDELDEARASEADRAEAIVARFLGEAAKAAPK